MGYEHQMPFYCIADGDFPAFLLRMIGVRKGGRERIEEHRGRVFKGYGVLGKVGRRLARVPLKSHARSLSHGIVVADSQPLPHERRPARKKTAPDLHRLSRAAANPWRATTRFGTTCPKARHGRNVRAPRVKGGAIRSPSLYI